MLDCEHETIMETIVRNNSTPSQDPVKSVDDERVIYNIQSFRNVLSRVV